MTSLPKWDNGVTTHSYGLQGHTVNYGQFIRGRRSGLITSVTNRRNPKGGGYIGVGPFFVVKEEFSTKDFPLSFVHDDNRLTTTIVPARAPGVIPPVFPHGSYADQVAFASDKFAKGYKLTRPDKEGASVGVFIAELARDGLPSLPLRLLSRVRTLKSAGSEYLNVAFGWKPLLNDLRKMYHLTHTLHRRLERLRKHNGQWESRKGTISDDQTVTQVVLGDGDSAFGGLKGFPTFAANPQHSTWIRTTTHREKVWYSSKYKYYTPNISSPLWTARATAALFGALPTPALLWEAMPWSWLVDWFGNVGDVISNLSPGAVDNLIFDNQCVMRNITEEITDSINASWGKYSFGKHSMAAGSCSLTYTYKSEIKCRVGGGNPFGFGFQMADASPYQLGILAALGLSRQKLL